MVLQLVGPLVEEYNFPIDPTWSNPTVSLNNGLCSIKVGFLPLKENPNSFNNVYDGDYYWDITLNYNCTDPSGTTLTDIYFDGNRPGNSDFSVGPYTVHFEYGTNNTVVVQYQDGHYYSGVGGLDTTKIFRISGIRMLQPGPNGVMGNMELGAEYSMLGKSLFRFTNLGVDLAIATGGDGVPADFIITPLDEVGVASFAGNTYAFTLAFYIVNGGPTVTVSCNVYWSIDGTQHMLPVFTSANLNNGLNPIYIKNLQPIPTPPSINWTLSDVSLEVTVAP